MRKYIYISIGGALGAVLRLAIKNNIFLNYSVNFPINTLVINITGCFFLVLFLTLTASIVRINIHIQLAVATGFLGAYTTFSTLCKEAVVLINNGKYIPALAYILLSTFLGLSSAYFGYIAANKIIGLRYVDNRIGNKAKIIDRDEVE